MIFSMELTLRCVVKCMDSPGHTHPHTHASHLRNTIYSPSRKKAKFHEKLTPTPQNEGSKVYSLLNDMQETGPPPDEIVNMMSQEMPDAMRGGAVPGVGMPGEQCCIQ